MAVHGFSVRMLTQTNLLGKLVEEGKKVALIVPDINDDNIKDYCSKTGVVPFQFNLQSPRWTEQYHNARRYFLEDIRNNTALWEKHIWSIRYNTSKNPWNHIRPFLLYFCYKLVKFFPQLRRWYKKREESFLASKDAYELIEKINPKVLISTYPVAFQEAMLLNAAKRQNIERIIHLLSWDNISCKGHFPELADEYIAWGPIMKQEFMEYYNIPENKIYMCGVPHFDLHIKSRKNPQPEKHLEALGLDPSKPYLFFGMSSPRFAPKEIDIVEWLANEIEKNTFGENMQLVVRPHPQNVQGNLADRSWLPRLKALSKGKVAVDFPVLSSKSKLPWSMQQNDMKRLSNLLVGSVVSLNSGSTMSIDALMCGVPVVLTSFDGDTKLNYWKSARRLIDYPHLKKLVSYGGIEVVDSFESMKNKIQISISNPNHIMDKRLDVINQQCSNYNDIATDKVVQVLLKK